MILENLTNNTLLAGIAITLVHFLWQGSLVALILKFLLSFVSYQKPQTRYALAAASMLVNLLLPLVTFFIVYDIEYRQSNNLISSLPILERGFSLEQSQINSWYSEWFEYLPIITICWFSIVSLLTIKLLIELYSVNSLSKRGAIAADAELKHRFNNLIIKIGLSKRVELLLSSKVDIPMAIGWLKPVVLIPFSMISGLTPQQLDMLLLHELAHIRRHDYLVNFLQTLVETFLFYHPAVRWVSKQMRNEREYCSDDIAVQHGGSALSYAHTLADTASLCKIHRHHTTPSMAMAASGGDLKQRVIRLLDNQSHCAQTTDTGKWLASFAILMIITFGVFQYLISLPVIDYKANHNHFNESRTLANQNGAPQPPATKPFNNNNISNYNSIPEYISRNKPIFSQNNLKNKIGTQNNLATMRINTIHSEVVPNNNTSFTIVDSTANHNIEIHLSQKQSSSELAFERTLPSNNSTVLNTPYSQKVQTLLNSTRALNSQLSTNGQIKNNTESARLTSTDLYDNVIRPINNSRLVNSFDSYQINPNHSAMSHHGISHSKQQRAQLIKSIEPKYPSAAKRNNIELEVKVEFNIDKNGLVKNIQFESKSKVLYFRNAIRLAMKKWRFLPAQKNGVAIESKMSKIFSFSLVK